ncbi:hypothetical protein ISP17_07200 [Dyella ginsengisoli]|uniref:Uncharacterized protein n=1 Tax=Dyella ginsengisoli TaxID=363848 RepID=A0ABW8JTH5_9GAMM
MTDATDRLKAQIRRNADEIARLHARIRETVRERDQSEAKRQLWQRACQEFHTRYDQLAFPGGLAGAFERLAAGDPETMETAICFVELRPYFLRSGYLFEKLLRRAGHAPLSDAQAARLESVRSARAACRAAEGMRRKSTPA